ncbi:MAG: glycoside hydrolase family 127 protein [Clostridia bacterium]|nr:glycoside hydrolase family 127 protein [Clostridia bacterium]
MKIRSCGKLTPLPLGSIRPDGWLREQLERSRDGMGGHIDELEPQMIALPYVNKVTNDGWGGCKAGWGAEISGNFWYGLMLLAFGLDDAFLKNKARTWVEGVLKNQDPDGYMGTYTDADDKMDDYNAWGTNSGMKAMLAYYDATGREDVLEAVHRCMLWFCENWAGDKKTRYCGMTLVESMSLCYLRTGDTRLLDFINDYIDFGNRNDLYSYSQNAMRFEPLTYNSHHAAGYAADLWIYAAAYQAGGDEKNLDAAVKGVAKLYPRAIQRTGGMPCHAEYLGPVSAAVETEYCNFAFLHHSLSHLEAASGDPKYMDLIERIVFNGAQGARKKDEKAIAYLSSPNQIYATGESCHFVNDMQLYAPVYPIACCPVTSTWVIPGFLRDMAFRGEDGLYIAGYGPATVDFGDLKLKMDTAYPFRDTVTCTVSDVTDGSTALHFRVPGWCKNARFSVNGRDCTAKAQPGTWYTAEGPFAAGDVITVTLPMTVEISRVDDGDAAARYPMAVEYGPLLFAFQVPEYWTAVKGNPTTPLPEGWNWWSVGALFDYDREADQYESNGMRKFDITWNIAMAEDTDPAAVQVEECPLTGYVWENPPLKLRLPGYKALFSYPPYVRKTMDLYTAPVDVHWEQELELVPFGCTNLRISYIPRAKLPLAPMPYGYETWKKRQDMKNGK